MTRTFSDGHPKVLPACNFLSQYYFYNIFPQKSCRFSLQTLTKFEDAKTGSGVVFFRLTAVWVQRHSGFEWICKHNRLRPEPIRFVRLDSEHAQSDGKSVNRELPGQKSRFLVLTKRNAASGDEIVISVTASAIVVEKLPA